MRGHRVDGLYPQHPLMSELSGPRKRSRVWEATGEESPSRVTEASNEAQGVQLRKSGAKSPWS